MKNMEELWDCMFKESLALGTIVKTLPSPYQEVKDRYESFHITLSMRNPLYYETLYRQGKALGDRAWELNGDSGNKQLENIHSNAYGLIHNMWHKLAEIAPYEFHRVNKIFSKDLKEMEASLDAAAKALDED